jgi:hypothetical protein
MLPLELAEKLVASMPSRCQAKGRSYKLLNKNYILII